MDRRHKKIRRQNSAAVFRFADGCEEGVQDSVWKEPKFEKEEFKISPYAAN
jgi:hypothetical protein